MRHMDGASRLQPQLTMQGPKRPLILGVVAAVLTVQALVLPILALVVLFAAADSPATYNGVEVTLGEVRLEVLGVLMVWFAFAAYVGPGLWQGKRTVRKVLFSVFVLTAVAGLVMTVSIYRGEPGFALVLAYEGVSNVFGCGLVGWYLFKKPNVREFFERGSNGFAELRR